MKISKIYDIYLRKCTQIFEQHNISVLKADLPSHWKTNLYLKKEDILTEEKFIYKINNDNEFAKIWV